MKPRHSALAATLLTTLGVVAAAAYGAWLWEPPRANGNGLLQRADTSNLDTQVLESMRELVPVLAQLSQPTTQPGASFNPAIFGFRTETAVREEQERVALLTQVRSVEQQKQQRLMDVNRHRVSMAYTSNDRRYAVIDDRVVEEGAILHGSGGRIQRIEPHRVLIQANGTQSWLPVGRP